MPTINEAFKTHGIRAEFEGMPAMVVPVTTEFAEDLDQGKIKQGVAGGQMLLSWNDGEKRNGKVINADARTDVSFLVKRNNGSDYRIPASNMADAVLTGLRAKKAAGENALAVADANEKAQADYDEARERGDAAVEPVEQEPEFAADAFDKLTGLVACVKEAQLAIKADEFAGIAAKAAADSFTAKLRELTRDDLTAADKAKVQEARQLKAEIAMLNPEHPDAAAAVMPAAYAGDCEAAEELMDSFPHDPEGISAAQQSAMSRNPDFNMVTRQFSVATTTPVMQIQKRALSHTGFKTIAQEIAKYENKEASDVILPRMAAVTTDFMEGYKWQGKVYSKDGADVLLMRDEYAAFVYAWDSESRVGEIDVTATVLASMSQDDVPSDEDLEALKATLAELRHDNGAEVNFDWDDEPEEDEVFEA